MLNEDMLILCEVIGQEAVENVIIALGGISLYIPKPTDGLIKDIANREKQLTVKQLALKLRVSERKIRQVLNA